MKHWKGGVVLGILALAAGTILVARPWSEPQIPAASTYSSALDLARDLSAHGLGCPHPHRVVKGVPADTVIGGVPVGLIAGAELCSVGDERVMLLVLPAAYMERVVTEQDVRDMQVPAILVGPNWVVIPQHQRDFLPALSAIRVAVGGRLVAAAAPTPEWQGTPV